MKRILLTGATGVVGSAVLRQLLASPAPDLVLLLRADDDAAASRRLSSLLGTVKAGDDAARRVSVLRGDVELPRLGLASADFDALAGGVDRIIHCAASVRMNLPLGAARRAAVSATANVLDLAQACRARACLEKVDLVSTVGVGGRRREPLPERWLEEPRDFHNTYEQAKAEAEALVQAQAAAGLPLTLHRPSMVVGDSRSGEIAHFQIFYHLAEFLSGRRTWGLLPDFAEHRIDLVPADYVARAIVWANARPETVGQILHLCAGPERSITLQALQAMVRRKFSAHGLDLPRCRVLPRRWFAVGARWFTPWAPAHLRPALGTLPLLLDYLSEQQSFANTRTRALLEAAGITLPAAEDFLEAVLDYYLKRV